MANLLKICDLGFSNLLPLRFIQNNETEHQLTILMIERKIS